MRESGRLQGGSAELAYESLAGAAPTFVWLPGFKADMAGTKVERLVAWAEARGQAFLRFDYSGHGKSGGRFDDGTISHWLADALAMIDAKADGPVVLVGSSMGAWIALLTARARPPLVKGLLLIAPAADFTERLMWPSPSDEAKRQLMEEGQWLRPSAYDPAPYPITRALIEDGRKHLVMTGSIAFDGPIRILQGEADPDVPARHALDLAKLLRTDDLAIEMIADGDHRLSRPQDLDKLVAIADRLADQVHNRLAH